MKSLTLQQHREIDQRIDNLSRYAKKGAYINYRNHPGLVNQVLEIMKYFRRDDISKIAQATGFKLRTLYDWRKKLAEDPHFNPLITHYGEHLRIFTDAEEDAISDYVIENIILKGIIFTDTDFKDLILSAFYEKYKNEENIPDFHISNGFIYDFKRNHNIVSRRCHFKRRPDNRIYDPIFCQEMELLFANVDHHYIVNVDETGWEVVPGYIKVWHLINKDHVVRYVNGNEKDKITVIASIAADGSKLPLQFIAKGETEAVLDTQIGDVGYHMRTCSSSGWTTAETFKAYLLGLRNYYGWEDENTIHLLLDIFKAHTQSDVRELAESLNIKLYYIPAGLTDELQPLDIKIFGPMKTFARRLFRERFRYDPDKKRTKRMACEDMVRSWERLTPDVIQEAFHRLMYIERWQAGDVPNCKINLNRHHRAYVRASPEERKLMDMTEEYKAF